MGWGTEPWGATLWGAGGPTRLRLVDALAVRENVVRLTFNTGVKFTRILDPGDASNIERFDIRPIEGTVGLDGEPVRAVWPAGVEPVPIAGAGQNILDVTTDRMMSPYPTQYRIAVNGLRSTSEGLLDPEYASKVFDGLHAGFPPKSVELAHRTRDIANPQDLRGLLDPLPHLDPLILGTIPVDATGDFAFDEGIDSYRKRVFRRLLTRKGSFAWMPTYGVGVPDQVKRLGRVGTRAEIAAEAEAQIRMEPETSEVACSFEQSRQAPGVWFLRVRVRTRTGTTIDEAVPFAAAGG